MEFALSFFALTLWYITFSLSSPYFWISLSSSICILVAISVNIDRATFKCLSNVPRDYIYGFFYACILYVIFYLGNEISSIIPLQKQQIDLIYQNKNGISETLITFLLILIIAPGEELFWRNFIQRRLSNKYGYSYGYIISTAMYISVHAVTLNLMLTLAATACSLFWGAMYLKNKRITQTVVCHIIWDVAIFIIFPLPGH